MQSSFRQFMLLTFFLLFAPASSLFLTFWVFEVLNHFTFLFPDPSVMEINPNFYSSVKVWATACVNYSLFHIGNRVTPPQAVLQEEATICVRTLQSKKAEPGKFTSAAHDYYAKKWMFLWKSVPKLLLSWKLDRQEWWILLWPVSTALNSGNCRMAPSPQEHYSGFCLQKLQCLSHPWCAEGKCWLPVPSHDVHHPHTCHTAKHEKQ